MNYEKLYYSIIENRKLNPVDGYTECHHILPRSLGGSDTLDNLVNLTAREHFICHLLLTKIYRDKCKQAKMIRAFVLMLVCSSKNQCRYVSSRKYEYLRKIHSEVQRIGQLGDKNSQYGTSWVWHELVGAVKVKRELVPLLIEQNWILGKYPKKARDKPKVSRKGINVEKVKIEAVDLYSKFIEGNYKSMREFAREEYTKSHVYLAKIWKLYVPEYSENVKQGKRFKSS